ncbi:hypothetical protein [Actinoplanes siamensis]|uniref:Uncharacterized protein n=1 Tax=Actinoplanes siamensis TaxID=1223317 RepID=A0A919N9E8_9ACTN|nr:hypothetical protein [Actinoplanes siamensis]GIF06722.1 hypothetical protein Asi03nite_42600 [Actinoplanes siamensis]
MSVSARFVVLGTVVALAGCGGDKPSVVSTPPSASVGSAWPAPRPLASAPAADNPPGLLTCRQLAVAVRDASLMEPGVIQGILAASKTADAPVADAARALGEAYEQALTSHGTQSEPDAVAAVSAAAADMSQVCADSGLDSAN